MILPDRPFCLIRHGQTDANRDGIIAGRIEAQLTDAGRAAAAALAGLDWPAAIVLFSSPQDRARDTAALAFPGQALRIIPGLRERDWGIHEGRPVAELPPRLSTPPAGEGWDAMLARIHAALCLCGDQAGAALPVIVAHSGVIRAARALTGQDFTGASAPNTTPLIYRRAAGRWQETPLFPIRDLPERTDA